MTSDLDIWHAGSSGPYLGQVRRSRFTVMGWKCSFFRYGCPLWGDLSYGYESWRDIFWLFVEFLVLKWSVRPRVRAF